MSVLFPFCVLTFGPPPVVLGGLFLTFGIPASGTQDCSVPQLKRRPPLGLLISLCDLDLIHFSILCALLTYVSIS